MIYAKLEEASSCRGLHARLDRVLELLTPAFLSSLGTEKVELDGEDIFVTRFDLNSSTDENRLFEYHRRYLDVFTLADGRERVDVASPGALELREQRGDYWGAEGKAEQSVILTPGSFLVLFPGDAHRPGMAVEGSESFSRVVFKVLL